MERDGACSDGDRKWAITHQEREGRETLHYPHAAWCADCVVGRGLKARCEGTTEVEGMLVTQIDCACGKTHSYERVHRVLNAINQERHCTISIWCDFKGGGDHFAMNCLKRYVEQLEVEETMIQCNLENSASGVAMRAAGENPNCTIKTSPRANKGSNGW